MVSGIHFRIKDKKQKFYAKAWRMIKYNISTVFCNI